MKETLKDGLDCHLGDYDGRTPLHLGCAEGHVEVIGYTELRKVVELALLTIWGSSPHELEDSDKGR